METQGIIKGINIAKKWLPPITEEDKKTVINIIKGPNTTFGIPLLKKYIEYIRPYIEILGLKGENKKPREEDSIASGIVFFYGCLVYIMHFKEWGSHIRDIVLYNILYILVDHYIDDVRIDPNIKDKAIAQMFILVYNPLEYENMTLIDPILKTIAITYNELIKRCPMAKSSIIKLFEIQIEGLKIQKGRNFDREEYYEIALKKGGYTLQVLQKIIGNNDEDISEISFHIGTIMQLIDDSLDIYTDKKNGINTIATNELERMGNIDELWGEIMQRIDDIDNKFIAFKILYSIFAVYIPDRIPNIYSTNLRSYTNKINLFDFNGSKLLVKNIMSEIMSMELLDF